MILPTVRFCSPAFGLLLLAFGILPACTSTSAPVESDAGEPAVRILAYNIKHGLGMDGKLDLERVAQLIRELDPDVVTLQEVDRGAQRSGGVDQAQWLAEACGMHAAFGAFMPYQGGEYGMAVLSRNPILEERNLRLPDGSEPRTALGVRTESPQGPLWVVGVHLYETGAQRMAQAKAMVAGFEHESLPVVLAGDFNSEPDDAVMRYLSGPWKNMPKSGESLTFPADGPVKEIDYCLVRPGASVSYGHLRVIPEPLVSDHRPLLLELWLR